LTRKTLKAKITVNLKNKKLPLVVVCDNVKEYEICEKLGLLAVIRGKEDFNNT